MGASTDHKEKGLAGDPHPKLVFETNPSTERLSSRTASDKGQFRKQDRHEDRVHSATLTEKNPKVLFGLEATGLKAE